MRIPNHIGIIPDGNRRWAVEQGLKKEGGYTHGISPGMELYRICREQGIREMTVYGFTADNVRRPKDQRLAFTDACVRAVEALSKEDAELLVLGNSDSAVFPEELRPYLTRQTFGSGGMKVNFLINYSFEWDLNVRKGNYGPKLASEEVSRIDLIIRWGGRRRLSGFLPLQSVYSDIYVVEDYWPDFRPEHVYQALEWYQKQDITLGG